MYVLNVTDKPFVDIRTDNIQFAGIVNRFELADYFMEQYNRGGLTIYTKSGDYGEMYILHRNIGSKNPDVVVQVLHVFTYDRGF